MTVYLYLDKDGILEGFGSTYSEGMVKADIDPENPLLHKLGRVKYENGMLFDVEEVSVAEAIRAKDEELNKACKDAIIDGFVHRVDGVDYKFSLDMEAQLNFQGAERLLSAGAIDEIYWTVRKMDGSYTRIKINKEVMAELSVKILAHKDGMISRYRDVLMPYVSKLKNLDDIKAVNWDSRVYTVDVVDDVLEY